MEEATTLTDHQQRKAIKILKQKGLIKQVNKGVPQKRYFKIVEDPDVLDKHLESFDSPQNLKNLRIKSKKNSR